MPRAGPPSTPSSPSAPTSPATGRSTFCSPRRLCLRSAPGSWQAGGASWWSFSGVSSLPKAMLLPNSGRALPAPLLASYLSLALVLFRQPNFAVADLEMRLQRRATSLALASLLEGYRAALAGDGTSVSSAGPGEQHLYIRLHYRLAALWLSRNSLGFQVAHHSFNATVPVGLLLALVVTVVRGTAVASRSPLQRSLPSSSAQAAGGCISAWQLAAGAFVLVWETNTLSGFAALNEELGAISAVYRAARREIGVLVSDAVAAGAEQGLVRGLEVHDRVLGTFLETDDLRALFFGFPISYGLLRTYVATAVTLAIGAWTVLRTLGVYITFQTFCPAV
ncbi:hypothetical protein DFJ74DRAFT_682155 [Hyaloraphidium curvatum]|nr:hypothetical protein DFJ74DRAFT_682155 [Hyaloraphidium curvatum]